MRLLKKSRRKEISSISTFVISLMNKIKIGICNYLNLRTKAWSLKQLKAYWLVFVLVGIAISLEVGIRAIIHSKSIVTFSSARATPVLQEHYPEYRNKRLGILLMNIRQYKRYLDTLSIIDSSKYSLILKTQPYLLDSLQALESILSKTLK
jgi:hypothetical protein